MPKDNSLIGLRAVGDPGADDIFHEAERQTGLSAMRALEALREPATVLPKELDELLDGWVRNGPELPSCADPKLIEAGQQFFNDWDLAICTSLFNASLPSAYAGAQGARVLSPVSQLAKRATVARRIGETGQLLLDITQPINVFPAKVVGRRMIQHWIDQQRHEEGPSISITAEQSRRWHLTERDNFVAAKRRQLRARRQRRRQPRARVPRSNSPAPTR